LYFFLFAPCEKFNRKEEPKEAQRAAKFFGVSGGKIEVFLCLRCAFASSASPREVKGSHSGQTERRIRSLFIFFPSLLPLRLCVKNNFAQECAENTERMS
jgi:hypothetical protein